MGLTCEKQLDPDNPNQRRLLVGLVCHLSNRLALLHQELGMPQIIHNLLQCILYICLHFY